MLARAGDTVDAPGPADNFKSDYKQQVLAAVDVVDLIGRTVPLKRRGKDYLGLCPFHQEKSPSFSVSPAKQFFHCYGCKASGNAIDFVMKRDRVPFLDALRLLGDAAGIERPHASPQARQAAGQRQQLLDCCSTAANLFQRLLAHPTAGAAGRAYLAQRGFNDDIAKRFQIGLAPDAWDRLLRAEAMRPFPPAVMAAAGLVKSREAAASGGNGNGFYDTFRNRLMFPIRDETGRVIAFGGRVLPGSTDGQKGVAKYLNSPETPLFSKGRTVFGLDLARQRVVETRTVAVVEGYADVVMAHQYGATNVVSVLGTALTEPHVTVLRRFADKIVLLFDADAAGDTAVNRAVELFLTQPVEIAIASLPDGLDPDEFLLAHGAEAFDAVLKGAADALTFTWKQLVRQFMANDGDLTGQERAVRQYLELLAKARASGPVDSLRWGSALTRVSRLTGIPVPDLNRRFSQPAPQQPTSQPPTAGGYRSGGPGRFNRTQRAGGDWKRRGPIGTGRPAFGRDGRRDGDGPNGPVDYRTLAERPVAPTARASAERWILAVLLAEPGLWHGLVDRVHVGDFTADDRRRLAELYWNHQRDEGEPPFNEFLEVLRSADGDLASLAVELVAEFEARPAGPDGEPTDPAVLLAEMVALLGELREGRVGDKLLADLRRTSGAPVTPAEVLRQLQERARRPDLRRVGS